MGRWCTSCPGKRGTQTKSLPFSDRDCRSQSLDQVKALCHRFCGTVCPGEKRRGEHTPLLSMRPHWSVQRMEEQHSQIDLGQKVPFDMAIPLPAKDSGFAETAEGTELFWEIFRCQRCGRCCFTPGAGLVLEEGDFDRIARLIGSKKKLRSLCRRDDQSQTWILKQPCPFFSRDRGCRIYPVRPLTCRKYPLHPPLPEMPYHLAVDAFCPAARELAKQTLGWWAICEAHWAEILQRIVARGRI
ncbi:MAG: Flagellin N-methylase [Methanosaeta sp. PtaB.Bin039]|nr:MAG: Flagellin N-methylase [Methanosaeta sp. PtaB.Bin039]HOT06170.1 YkgJ family cysteine cluster protein [Methanotrichaceae archaeon]HQF15521.1 YkgJ family cysteine cluster protein [Methanotrichaceae archaeon]HQI90256.1 YkgJ family cysteine cluster protein [Methanotrichaceae archaeon]HQJ27775.1 YkgJ family cysteine cluster protein [Methanotrichaceae archaeon]